MSVREQGSKTHWHCITPWPLHLLNGLRLPVADRVNSEGLVCTVDHQFIGLLSCSQRSVLLHCGKSINHMERGSVVDAVFKLLGLEEINLLSGHNTLPTCATLLICCNSDNLKTKDESWWECIWGRLRAVALPPKRNEIFYQKKKKESRNVLKTTQAENNMW